MTRILSKALDGLIRVIKNICVENLHQPVFYPIELDFCQSNHYEHQVVHIKSHVADVLFLPVFVDFFCLCQFIFLFEFRIDLETNESLTIDEESTSRDGHNSMR